MAEIESTDMTEFNGVNSALAKALDERGFEALTPVQEAVLDPACDGADLLVSAQTGSGKTVAFGIAGAPTLLGDDGRVVQAEAPVALAIAPTRELALQIKAELSWLYREAGARLATCVGGMDMSRERQALSRGANIVAGTPGRLRDHIERGSFDTSCLKLVVLDEADEMLDMGFREDLEYILQAAPRERRTFLFSATVPKPIANMAKRFQKDAVRIDTVDSKGQHADIDYQALTVAPNDKENAIVNVLRYYQPQNALIFCSTRATVNHMTSRFANRGIAVVALSGDLNQNARNHALQAMRDGRAQVCIATDVAARGIDLPNLDLVVHADIPRNEEALLHRSGRTGRAGRKGICALIVPHNWRKRTERLLKSARIVADWTPPPTAAQIREKDQERLVDNDALQAPIDEDERSVVDRLVEQYQPEQLAAAYMRQFMQDKSAPEELLSEAPKHKDKPNKRQDFEDGVWVSLSVGRDHNAEPRWILPTLCRAGQLTKKDIGAIRIHQRETHVELRKEAIEDFLAAVGPSRKIEKTITVDRLEGVPEGPRYSGSAKPKQGDYAKKRPFGARKQGGDRDDRPRRNFRPEEDAATGADAAPAKKPKKGKKKPHKKKLARAAAKRAKGNPLPREKGEGGYSKSDGPNSRGPKDKHPRDKKPKGNGQTRNRPGRAGNDGSAPLKRRKK